MFHNTHRNRTCDFLKKVKSLSVHAAIKDNRFPHPMYWSLSSFNNQSNHLHNFLLWKYIGTWISNNAYNTKYDLYKAPVQKVNSLTASKYRLFTTVYNNILICLCFLQSGLVKIPLITRLFTLPPFLDSTIGPTSELHLP